MKLTKEMLIDWIDRPPSNSDLDLINKIIELEKRVEQYENPDDLTLFYMWLDAKAKDKMKQLEKENKKYKDLGFEHLCKRNEQLEKENKILRENAEHNDKVVDKVNWEINILKNNRDKAINLLDLFISDTNLSKYDTLKILMHTKKLLKGDSE